MFSSFGCLILGLVVLAFTALVVIRDLRGRKINDIQSYIDQRSIVWVGLFFGGALVLYGPIAMITGH
jgi:hypothetical protein